MGLKYYDTHTAGEPTRIVYEGFPELKGSSMMEKKNFVIENYPEIRTKTMLEPRGHENMFGAIVLEPAHSEADKGVIFMDTGGYLNMCGHGSIGVATFLVETGIVEKKEPYTEVVLDAPAGLIRTKVFVENNIVKGVAIQNVPAFLYKENITISTESLKDLKLDISYGGNFFALVDVENLGLKVQLEDLDLLKKYAMEIRDELARSVKVSHPTEAINSVDLVEIYEKPKDESGCYKNVVIFGAGQVDRSPCGTGTSAKIATLYAKKELELNEEFRYQSIIGTEFIGKVLSETNVEDLNAIIPEVKGRAFVIGKGETISNEEDMLDSGFLL